MLGELFPYLVIRPGERLEARLDGELDRLVVAIGPNAGSVAIRGGGPPERHLLWDEWCHYERLRR